MPLAVAWEPPVSRGVDSAGDGLLDHAEASHDKPEHADAFEDSEGCPEPTGVATRSVGPLGAPITIDVPMEWKPDQLQIVALTKPWASRTRALGETVVILES